MEKQQREIVFRAWLKEDDSFNKKGMYTGFSFSSIYSGIEEANTTCQDGKTIQEPDWDKLIVMQFTGLHDKSGKKIYEEDIINFSWYKDIVSKKNRVNKAVIRFGKTYLPDNEGYAGNEIIGFYLEGLDTYDSHMDYQDTYEVIGNIYENPELLQKDNINEEE